MHVYIIRILSRIRSAFNYFLAVMLLFLHCLEELLPLFSCRISSIIKCLCFIKNSLDIWIFIEQVPKENTLLFCFSTKRFQRANLLFLWLFVVGFGLKIIYKSNGIFSFMLGVHEKTNKNVKLSKGLQLLLIFRKD